VAGQAEQDHIVAAVALAGGAEGDVQAELNPRGEIQLAVMRQPQHEQPRRRIGPTVRGLLGAMPVLMERRGTADPTGRSTRANRFGQNAGDRTAIPECQPMSEEPTPEHDKPPSPWRRVVLRAQALRRPLLLMAGTGAVLGGLAGYWNAYQAVKGARASDPQAADALLTHGEQRTVAVLAFANLGDAAADDGFSEGVGEELVHVLSRVPGLRVIGRRSALEFKGQSVALTEVARRLQATYLVEGSVRRNGGSVRIAARLVNGSSGAVLWSGQFERSEQDLMAAQADLALQIAGGLKLPLDASTLAGSGTRSAEAWRLFMQAQRLPPGQRSVLYQRALALDPRFARAHVELAEEVLAGDWRGRDAPAVGAAMVPHLEAALRIDPRLALAHGRLATAAALADDLEAMRRHAANALQLDPGDMAALNWSAELALRDVRVEDSLALRRKMVDVEPLSPLARLHLAERLRLANQPAQALAAVEQALLLKPDWRAALVEKALVLLELGRRDEALALARPFAWVDVFVLAGSADDLASARRSTGLNEHRLAALALADGRYDIFFDHFEADHSDFMDRNIAMFDRALDPVREQPRFRAWLARHGMQDAHDKAQAWRAANPRPR
jgi:TolB-like protein